MGIHILKSDIDNANIFAVYYASKLIPETDLSPPTGYQEAGAKLRKIKLKNNIQLLIIRHVDAPPTRLCQIYPTCSDPRGTKLAFTVHLGDTCKQKNN